MDLKKIERVQGIDRSWVKPHLRARLDAAEKARQPMSFIPPPGYLEWDPSVSEAENESLGATDKSVAENRFDLYPGDVVCILHTGAYEEELQIFMRMDGDRATCLRRNDGGQVKLYWVCEKSMKLVARKGEWIPWVATESSQCPIPNNTPIEVQLAGDYIIERVAGRFIWEAHSSHDDIVRFRLI